MWSSVREIFIPALEGLEKPERAPNVRCSLALPGHGRGQSEDTTVIEGGNRYNIEKFWKLVWLVTLHFVLPTSQKQPHNHLSYLVVRTSQGKTDEDAIQNSYSLPTGPLMCSNITLYIRRISAARKCLKFFLGPHRFSIASKLLKQLSTLKVHAIE